MESALSKEVIHAVILQFAVILLYESDVLAIKFTF